MTGRSSCEIPAHDHRLLQNANVPFDTVRYKVLPSSTQLLMAASPLAPAPTTPTFFILETLLLSPLLRQKKSHTRHHSGSLFHQSTTATATHDVTRSESGKESIIRKSYFESCLGCESPGRKFSRPIYTKCTVCQLANSFHDFQAFAILTGHTHASKSYQNGPCCTCLQNYMNSKGMNNLLPRLTNIFTCSHNCNSSKQRSNLDIRRKVDLILTNEER